MRKILAAVACGVVTCAVMGQTLPDYVGLLPLPVPFDSWIWAGSPPGDTSRLFVMEGGGTIRILDISRQPGQFPSYSLRTTPFLAAATGLARSVAFAPDFATSGRFYVAGTTTTGGNSVIREFTVSASDPNVADPASARVVMTFLNYLGDHALGSMHFGRDGMLYIGAGDGGADIYGQATYVPRAKMLRIDVLSGQDDFPADAMRNYHVPTDNPLVNRPGAAPEIWHIGLRNPWRWSFDRWNGDMWICDVGANLPGEIDHVVGTGTPYSNFGWLAYDGTSYLGSPINPDFTVAQLIWPLLAFPTGHGTQGEPCATIGGVMYRGNGIRPWRGRFVWSDACTSDVYSAAFDGAELGPVQAHLSQLRDANTGAVLTVRNVSMVAEDGAGELYVTEGIADSFYSGRVYCIVPVGPQPPLADVGRAGGVAGADGLLDNNDFIAFITMFFSNDPGADMGVAGGVRGVDQVLNNNDFIAFIGAFFDGN